MKKHLISDKYCKHFIYEFDNGYGLNVRCYENYQGLGEKYIIVVIKNIRPDDEFKYLWDYEPNDNKFIFGIRNQEVEGDECYTEDELKKAIELMNNIS
jgi:hypothetical protein